MEICCQLQITNITKEIGVRLSGLKIIRPKCTVRLPMVWARDTNGRQSMLVPALRLTITNHAYPFSSGQLRLS